MRPTLLKRSVKPERRSGASPAEVATQGGVKEVSTIVPRDDVIGQFII